MKKMKQAHRRNQNCFIKSGVGLGRVVRKVRQHPDDHEFKSQQWQ
jgi:hypothetical protein